MKKGEDFPYGSSSPFDIYIIKINDHPQKRIKEWTFPMHYLTSPY